MSDAAFVGERELIGSLGALGFSPYYAKDAQEAREAITMAEKDGAKVIFIFEKLAHPIMDTIKAKTFPVIVLVPDHTGSTGLANGLIKKAMAKAIGSEVLAL